MNTQNKRDRLVDSADTLFHRKGISATSLADIARHADIPIGNVYYYFKTKEELALAAIERRKLQFRVAYGLLDEGFADPRQRLVESLTYFDQVREEYTKYGCPIGKIIKDADVEKDAVAKTAAQILADYVEWASRQFRQLGHADVAHAYAVSLMAGVQGAAIMAKALRDSSIISAEVARLTIWLQTLPNRRIQLGKVGIRPAVSASTAA